MAHQINFNEKKGTHSFASNGEKAWHNLGQVVNGAMTSEEAIKLANLDYEVDKTTIHARIEGVGEEGIVLYEAFDNRFATYRKDTNEVLGIVGNRYQVIQNKDSFSFFDAIIDEGEAIFETAGVLGKGERIFVTAKLPDDMLVGGEPCSKYIILTNSHDGSSSIIAGLTTVRIVCNNTLQAALQGLSNKVTIQHRVGFKERLNEAHKVMNIASKYMSEVEDIFNVMAKTECDDKLLKEYITQVMKPEYKGVITKEEEEILSTRFKNQVETIYNFALSHPTQITNDARGTIWGAYNSISGYYNYEAKNFKNAEDKFSSVMFGNANTKILKGFDKALELINN